MDYQLPANLGIGCATTGIDSILWENDLNTRLKCPQEAVMSYRPQYTNGSDAFNASLDEAVSSRRLSKDRTFDFLGWWVTVTLCFRLSEEDRRVKRFWDWNSFPFLNVDLNYRTKIIRRAQVFMLF